MWILWTNFADRHFKPEADSGHIAGALLAGKTCTLLSQLPFPHSYNVAVICLVVPTELGQQPAMHKHTWISPHSRCLKTLSILCFMLAGGSAKYKSIQAT